MGEGYSTKEEEGLIQSVHDICARQVQFNEALRQHNYMEMAYIFSREQACHISSLADSIQDPHLKAKVETMAAEIKFSVDEMFFK